MDKDVIRIIIFAIGLTVILGMIAWSYIQHEKQKHNASNFDDLLSDDDTQEEQALEAEDVAEEVVSLEEARLEKLRLEEMRRQPKPRFEKRGQKKVRGKPEPRVEKQPEPEPEPYEAAIEPLDFSVPAIIQLSIVAPTEMGFNGVELFEILDDMGLEYGNLQIFERLDARRLVDFGVASMVKPGIFPSVNLAAFYSQGIVFFMQPSKLDNPAAVFEDFIRTFKFVAAQLGGEMWDYNREPLTEETITHLRRAFNS